MLLEEISVISVLQAMIEADVERNTVLWLELDVGVGGWVSP